MYPTLNVALPLPFLVALYLCIKSRVFVWDVDNVSFGIYALCSLHTLFFFCLFLTHSLFLFATLPLISLYCHPACRRFSFVVIFSFLSSLVLYAFFIVRITFENRNYCLNVFKAIVCV